MNSPPNGNTATMTVVDGDAGVRAGIDAEVLSVALARSSEASSRPPLFTDPFVRSLLDASAADESVPQSEQIVDHVAARTKWFDDFFLAASSSGIAQIVVLSPGLDTRPWRLPWLDDTVIYEVDRPEILEFKSRILSGTGATPTARYVPVPVDRGMDWTKALTASGFDHTDPSAWAAEGLLPALEPDTSDHLLERVDLYSARGSRIAVETTPEADTDVSCWLCARHWEVSVTPAEDLMTRYHRAVAAEDHSVFVDARKL